MTRSIEFNGYHYTEVALERCRDIALGLDETGKNWHSHVLSPGCRLNPFPDLYAIVVEDNTDDVTYVASSDGFPEVDKELVKILHGDDILDADKIADDGSEGQESSTLLALVEDLDGRGVAWHHHMHFPDCVFNPRRGQWAISVEHGDGAVADESYAEEPVDVLRRIEVAYFSNLEAKS